ncbi:MAG: sigma-70 family RNA polymerase sigma factor [Phycisphaerales bacterium]|nr:sigma-70 family RNA polymerase sigma factor [Phycisphaerales bacterium]
MSQLSDEQLLALHLDGSPEAFNKLVDRYSNELFGFLCRFVGNAAAAEDLVQETFVQVYLAAETFDEGRRFRPWLYTIAANKGRDHLRARGRRVTYSLDTSGPDDSARRAENTLEAGTAPVDETLGQDERAEQVRRIVSGMPENMRLVLTLGYFEQLPYAEIAEVLDIPVGTVKSRLHAAVNQFAKLWREQSATTG